MQSGKITQSKASPDTLSEKDKAATTIQKHFRGFITRKKYAITPLKKDELTSYPTFVVGNDPCMPAALDKYTESDVN